MNIKTESREDGVVVPTKEGEEVKPAGETHAEMNERFSKVDDVYIIKEEVKLSLKIDLLYYNGETMTIADFNKVYKARTGRGGKAFRDQVLNTLRARQLSAKNMISQLNNRKNRKASNKGCPVINSELDKSTTSISMKSKSIKKVNYSPSPVAGKQIETRRRRTTGEIETDRKTDEYMVQQNN